MPPGQFANRFFLRVLPVTMLLNVLFQYHYTLTSPEPYGWPGMRMDAWGFPFLSDIDCEAYCGTSGGHATNGIYLLTDWAFWLIVSACLVWLMRRPLNFMFEKYSGAATTVSTILLAMLAQYLLVYFTFLNADNHWYWQTGPIYPECYVLEKHGYIFFMKAW